MRTKSLLSLIILFSSAVWGADKIQPLDVKMGLWEVTNTTATTGLPPIPPEVLARMPPEQQAALGARGPKTTTRKDCITKEKLDKQMLFGEERKECTRTVVSSSSSKLEMKIQCTQGGTKMDGTFRLDVLNSENVRGAMQFKAASADQTASMNVMNVNSDFTAKWLSPVCGDVK